VKPHVISVFGDIAMAIEGDFDRYTSIVFGILKQAGEGKSEECRRERERRERSSRHDFPRL
jgi:hypothetical protein